MGGAVEAGFRGWRVVGAAFVLAMFGWGLGLYGPPVYLHAVRESRGWPVALISAAVSVHFLVGALLVAHLPRLHRRWGLIAVTRAAALAVGLGVLGWAFAREPWQMFLAAGISGAGWAGTSAAAVNAILSPWFVRERARALAFAYNGASFGGIVFQPLWVQGLLHLGYLPTAVLIAGITVAALWVLAGVWFGSGPEGFGQRADGDAPGAQSVSLVPGWVRPLPGRALLGNWQFRTLVVGTALSLFAQTGLLVLLLSHLVPALGPAGASWLMSGATVAAMAGRTVLGLFLRPSADRRLAIVAAVGVQVVASALLLAAGGTSVPLLVLGVILFGAGLGNAVSLPPLIAQVEFGKDDVPRVVALTIAWSQGTYAFAPAVFGLIVELDQTRSPATPSLFAIALLIQVLAIAVYLAGRRRA